MHDFPDKEKGKAVPYGIYDIHQVVVSLIGSTKTTTGLIVHAELDQRQYTTGRKISNKEMATINLKPNRLRGEWNYVIHPRDKCKE